MVTTVKLNRAGPSLALAAALVALNGCQVGGSTVGERDGYFTWVDAQGRVQYSPIPDAQDSPDTVAEASAAAGDGDTTAAPAPAPEPETEYTLENYPDGNQLAEEGFIRPGDRQPYFTWKDAEGNVRVSYYRPNTGTEQQKGRLPPPVEITPATIYQPGQPADIDQPVSGHDPNAFAILGIEQEVPFFQRFAETCCQALNTDDYTEWGLGREFQVDLTEDSPKHSFVTGDSPYALVALPAADEYPDFILHLRSYGSKRLFVPSLAFLDERLRPLRVVTDLAYAFTPESWHTRAFLEAWVPAFPDRGERWLLIFTDAEDLAGQTVTETRHGPKALSHSTEGELGLELVADD